MKCGLCGCSIYIWDKKTFNIQRNMYYHQRCWDSGLGKTLHHLLFDKDEYI